MDRPRESGGRGVDMAPSVREESLILLIVFLAGLAGISRDMAWVMVIVPPVWVWGRSMGWW